MTGHFYRLNPDHPLCWEDSFTLRAGFDRVLARVHNPSPEVQRLIRVLQTGVPANQYPELCDRLGVQVLVGEQLLHDLRRVLLGHVDSARLSAQAHDSLALPEQRLYVRICDDGRSAAAFRQALLDSGFCTLNLVPEKRQRSDLVVVVERFYTQQRLAQQWILNRVPHLLIRFTDESATVGPLISPTGAPCLDCIAQHSVTADPALPALAAQLVGKQAAAETPASTALATATALTMVRLWRQGDISMHSTQVRFTVRGGLVATAPHISTISPFPDCACSTLELMRSVG